MHETGLMAKKRLNSEPLSYPDLAIIGISSQLKDYRLVHHINRNASLSLSKLDDLPVFQGKSDELPTFSLYGFYESAKRLSYYLIANNNQTTRLLPSLKQADYFLMTCGPSDSEYAQSFIEALRHIEGVQMAFSVDPTQIKNIDGVMIDLELHMVGKKI